MSNNIISVKTGSFDSEYILEEQDNGILIKVPYLDQDEEGNEIIDHNIVEIANGTKASIIRQFFLEESTAIIRGGAAYSLDDILFDETAPPDQIEPDDIQD